MTSVADLSTLLKQTTISSHEDLLSAANAALKTNKNDVTAQHSKVVALLKLDRYDDAVKTCEAGGESLQNAARIEYAYALYKAGSWEKASQLAGPSSGKDRGLSHVLAQTAYRLEKFDDASKVYEELSKESEGADESVELRINRGAVDAQLEWKGLGHLVRKKKPQREDLEAFESAYNVACAAIARGELAQGEVLLRRARDLLQASEDLEEEEKVAELLPVTVQHVYVLSMQGRIEEARKLCDDLPVDDISDLCTQRIAKVNTLASSALPSNPFLLQRDYNDAPPLMKNDVPFDYQSTILQQNKMVVDLMSMKFSGVAGSTSGHDTSSPSISVLKAAAHARGQTGKPALNAILPYLEQRPSDVGLLLTVVQLYIMTNNYTSAVQVMERFLQKLEESSSPDNLDVRFAPGLVGTLISLYNTQGRKGKASSQLAKAASYWRSKTKGAQDSTRHASLLKAAGSALLHSSSEEDLSEACDIFRDIHAEDATDKAATAGLVASLALTDYSSIQKADLDSLPQAARLVAGIDVASLEEAGVARPEILIDSSATKKRTAEDVNSKASKPKKIRKSRLPKDFDANKKIDPERWLPLRDRSNWKPKGKKGKRAQAGLTQGGPVAEEKTAPAQVVQSNDGGAAKKKKKGKGGR